MSVSERSRTELIARVKEIVARGGDADEKLKAICSLLRREVPHYDWVGFYVADADEKELTLGPFAGEPTEHVRIPFGRGICGRAATERKTVVVDDVSCEACYLACSPLVRSEVVLPVFKGNRPVAELDIDSHTPEAFTNDDLAFLEEVVRVVRDLF